VLHLGAGFGSQAFVKLLYFELVLFFKFLKTQICSGFIITHVIIPCAAEFKELRSLCTFDSYQFLLLSLTHVLEQSQHFLVAQVLELELGFARLRQIQLCATLLAMVV